MPYSASLIAYAFVKKGIEDGIPVTQMKLQKLVYFANGIHLAQHGTPLIKEKFQAWKFGPVVRNIYNTFRFYGSEPISDTYWLFLSGDLEKELKKLDSEAQTTISATWESLKTFTAAQLSNWTHKSGSPWEKVFVAEMKDVIIPDDDIKEYFKRYLVK